MQVTKQTDDIDLRGGHSAISFGSVTEECGEKRVFFVTPDIFKR